MILLYQLYALGLLRLSSEGIDETETWSFLPLDILFLLAIPSSERHARVNPAQANALQRASKDQNVRLLINPLRASSNVDPI